MKILSVGNFGHGWDGSICDEEHIAKALEELGHEVNRLQREEIQNARPVHEIFPGHGYDFILLAQYDGYPESMIPWMKKDKCPIVYWAFDYQADGQEWHERLIRECDVYLSKPLSDAKKHKNWRWLSQDFCPDFLGQPTQRIEKDIDVLFTGSFLPWGRRNEIIKKVDENFNLTVHSVTSQQWTDYGIKNSHGPIMDRDLMGLYPRAKIVLSVDHTWAPGYWSDRNFQAMAIGAFVLFKHVPLSESTFGEGVAYFHTDEDMLEKIRFYLEYGGDRGIIADKGKRLSGIRGHAKHRVKDLMTIMGEFL